MPQVYKITPMRKFDFNIVAFIEIAFLHVSLPVNLLHIFVTPFYKNTSRGLLLLTLI